MQDPRRCRPPSPTIGSRPSGKVALASAIEAEQAAVARFAETAGFNLIAEFGEAASRKGADALERSPQLARALAAARSQRCPVIVAKPDRPSRNVAFIANLMATAGLVSPPDSISTLSGC